MLAAITKAIIAFFMAHTPTAGHSETSPRGSPTRFTKLTKLLEVHLFWLEQPPASQLNLSW
jgi:hypothetical protein